MSSSHFKVFLIVKRSNAKNKLQTLIKCVTLNNYGFQDVICLGQVMKIN